jgi:hypothetical protein
MYNEYMMKSIHKNDKVKIIKCAESENWGHIIFTVISEPWLLGSGTEVVRITSEEKDIVGGFATKFLKKVK